MKKLSLLLAPALFLSSSVLAVAQERTGTVTLELKNFFGLEKTGGHKPSANELCQKKFGDLAGPAKTTYHIDPSTLKMFAEATFHGETYRLPPLGISGIWAFGYYQDASQHNPPIYGVLFSISKEFTDPSSSIILVLDKETNCLLTSSNAALKTELLNK